MTDNKKSRKVHRTNELPDDLVEAVNTTDARHIT